jgi:ankyrin repeat protein
VREGHAEPEILKMVIDAGANVPNVRDKAGTHVITYAANLFYMNEEIVEMILAAGVSVQNLNTDMNSQLSVLLGTFPNSEDNIDFVKIFTCMGTVVNVDNDHPSDTALMYVVRKLKNKFVFMRIVKMLIDGVAHEKCNKNSALMLAVQHQNSEIVQLLIEAGADVNAKDKDGNSALLL